MEELWLFSQAISIFLFWCGAVVCLVNADMANAVTLFGAPAPSYVASLQRHGDFDVNAVSGQLPDSHGDLLQRFGEIY